MSSDIEMSGHSEALPVSDAQLTYEERSTPCNVSSLSAYNE